MSVGRGREDGGQRLSPPSFPPLTRRDRDILYIRSIYSLSVPRTNSNFPDFVPQRDILENFRLCPCQGQQTFFDFVLVPIVISYSEFNGTVSSSCPFKKSINLPKFTRYLLPTRIKTILFCRHSLRIKS